MFKKLIAALATITIVISLTACQSHSEKNIHEILTDMKQEAENERTTDE